MATNILIAGADFSANPIGFSPPVSRGLLGFGLPGIGTLTGAQAQAKAARNLAPGGVSGSLVGSPTLGALFASFVGQSKYLDTLLLETKSITLLAVAKSAATLAGTDLPAILGQFSTGSQPHAFMNLTANGASPAGIVRITASRLDAQGAVVSSSTQRTVADVTVPRFYAGRVEDGVGQAIIDKTGGLSTALANTNARTTPGAATIRAGSFNTNGYVGAVDEYFWAVYGVALTDAEIEKIYQWAKAYFARRGVTI